MKRSFLVVAGCAGLLACEPAREVVEPVKTAPLPLAEASVPHLILMPSGAEAKRLEPGANAALARRVQRALEEEARIHAAAIDVTAQGGMVTLWGTATSPDERQRAARIAYRVIGVTGVENRIAVVNGS